MKKNNLTDLPISNLSLLVLDESIDGVIQIKAEDEIKNRMKGSNISYLDILDFDYRCYEKRGYNIDNYLFCKNPNLQMIMELYYKECFGDIFQENNLVFSERHFCNDMLTRSPLFLYICKEELKRLKSLIEDKNLEIDKKKYLNSFYKALSSRIFYAKERKEIMGNGYDAKVEQLNSFLSGYYNFNEKLTMQEQHINQKIIKNDSKKLTSQKSLLLSELKNGGIIDYETLSMKKIYKKVKENIGVHKFF